MKTRIALTVITACLFAIAKGIVAAIYAPVSGALTAAQLDDSVSSYVAAKIVRDGAINSALFWLLVICILIIWLGPLIRHFRPSATTATALLLVWLAGCTPVKVPDVIEIKSNETAWAIPMDGSSQTSQVKFNSVGFLNQHKIASKRVWIDKVERKTGRFYWDIAWIPSTQVISVDRSLVTGQWTDGDPHNDADNNGIRVVTRDSVALRVGLTITANIEEDDASTYLYYHGARPLSQVMGQNIRSFAISELTREYSQLSLAEAQAKGDSIYSKLFMEARDAFKPKGVTIQYMGNAEGLTYDDPNVQQSINASYVAHQSAITAQQEQDAQKIRNTTLVMNAQTEADAAQKLLAAKEASLFKNDLNIRTMTAQANLQMANRWNGSMPANVLPSNSPMLMNFGTAKTP